MASTVVLTKAGPRLIDFCLDTDELSIQVNGPGMLFEKLELMTNRTALDGATVQFYEDVATGLAGTVDCPHAGLQQAAITVEPHRLGAELSIDLGPASMYQSELRLRTVSGETFRALIERALGPAPATFPREGDTIAVLIAVRATGHHEHHASARAAIRRNAAGAPGGSHEASHATGGH